MPLSSLCRSCRWKWPDACPPDVWRALFSDPPYPLSLPRGFAQLFNITDISDGHLMAPGGFAERRPTAISSKNLCKPAKGIGGQEKRFHPAQILTRFRYGPIPVTILRRKWGAKLEYLLSGCIPDKRPWCIQSIRFGTL